MGLRQPSHSSVVVVSQALTLKKGIVFDAQAKSRHPRRLGRCGSDGHRPDRHNGPRHHPCRAWPYNNPHWLIVRTGNSTLHAYDVSGCGGFFGDGDPVTLHAIFDVTYLVITSP
jgi:hypothetical protein